MDQKEREIKSANLQSLMIESVRLTEDAVLNQEATIYRVTGAFDTPSGKKEGPKYETSFVTFKGFAGNGAKYLKKGATINVIGSLRQEKWAGKDGSPRSRIVVWVDNFKIAKFAESAAPASPSQAAPSQASEEEVPF